MANKETKEEGPFSQQTDSEKATGPLALSKISGPQQQKGKKKEKKTPGDFGTWTETKKIEETKKGTRNSTKEERKRGKRLTPKP